MDNTEIVPGSPDDPFAELPRLGQLFRHMRKRAGLSQRDLAMYSRVDQANISMIESGKTASPHNSTLEIFAGIFAHTSRSRPRNSWPVSSKPKSKHLSSTASTQRQYFWRIG